MPHVNEYNPSSKKVSNGVQTDAHKLKFNNIQSCLAVVLCVYTKSSHGAPTFNKLVGVHLNTKNLQNSELELNIAISQLKQDSGKLVDVYLVGPYDQQYTGSRLIEKLKYLAPRTIKLLNLTPAIEGAGANKDVKVEVNGLVPQVFTRDCVQWQYGVLKDKYDPAKGGTKMPAADKLSAGKHDFVNDRDKKPWQMETAFRIVR